MPEAERQLATQGTTAQGGFDIDLGGPWPEAVLDSVEADLARLRTRLSKQLGQPYSASAMAKSIRPTLWGALIGRVFGDARERAGLTQRAAAAKLGVRQSSLADIETGRRAVTVEETLRLIELYDIPLSAVDVRGVDPSRALVRRSRGRPRASDFEAAAEVSPPELRQEAERRLRDSEEAFRFGRIDAACDNARVALSMVVADAGWRVGRLPSPDDSLADVLAHLGSYREIAEVGQFAVLIDMLLLSPDLDARKLRRIIRLIRTVGELVNSQSG